MSHVLDGSPPLPSMHAQSHRPAFMSSAIFSASASNMHLNKHGNIQRSHNMMVGTYKSKQTDVPAQRTGINSHPRLEHSHRILVHLLETWYLFQDLNSNYDKLGSITKLAAKNLFTSLGIWGLLYEGKHVPLTDDTVEFSAKIPDAAAMAAAEEGKIESESGSVNSKPSYLPSASRIQAYLHRKRPEKVPAKEGDPQAAIHGQWRHAALMQFTEEERVEIFGFEKAMRAKMAGRRLFCTMEGLLGLGPRSLFYERQIAYRVFILKGTKVPSILKRLGNGTYRLVGDAYIHGIMHGEAIETLERASSDRSWCQRIKLA